MNVTGNIQSWLSGEKFVSQWMNKQLKMIGLIALFIFIYIMAGYRSLLQQQYLAELRKEVKDAKFEYLTVSAERTALTRQSRVAEELKARGSKVSENRKAPLRLEK